MGMDESPLLFEPVPLRSRRDGWTPERQHGFIRWLRQGVKPGTAAGRVGMRRQVVAMERRYDNSALIRLLGILGDPHRNPANGESGLFSPMDAELCPLSRRMKPSICRPNMSIPAQSAVAESPRIP